MTERGGYTTPADKQPPYRCSMKTERRIKSITRWRKYTSVVG